MTEKYLGDPDLINQQNNDAYIDTYLGEYEIYNSSLEHYRIKFNNIGREAPFDRIARLRGTILDIGCSTQMLITLQAMYPDIQTVGIGVRLSESENMVARANNVKIIEGSLFHPPHDLQLCEGKCQVILSKNTFTQFGNLNLFSALEYVWDLLSYNQEPLLTGAAYIHMGLPKISDTHNHLTNFSVLCDRMTQEGFDIYPFEEKYGTSVVVMTKTKSDSLKFPIIHKLDQYYWHN